MKKFLIVLTSFSIVLLLMCAIIEFALIYRPNIYAYKYQYLEQHQKDIKVLLLGSSHIEEAVMPELVGDGVFNLAISARLHEYDVALAEMFVPRMDSLQTIVMPIDYTNFFFERYKLNPLSTNNDPEALVGTCRCMHTKYMNTRIDPIWYWSEIINSKLNYMSRFWNNRQILQECDSLGYVRLSRSERQSGWEYRALPALFDPEKNIDRTSYDEMWQIYAKLAHVTGEHHVRLVLVIPPVYETYKASVHPTVYHDMEQFISRLKRAYPNIEYYNFFYAPGFTSDDFNDSSHLTDLGAEKFSKMLKAVL